MNFINHGILCVPCLLFNILKSNHNCINIEPESKQIFDPLGQAWQNWQKWQRFGCLTSDSKKVNNHHIFGPLLGKEPCPRPLGEDHGMVVFDYMPTSPVNYFR